MHPLIDLKYVFLPGHHPKPYHVWALCSSLKDTYEHIFIMVYIKSTVTDCLELRMNFHNYPLPTPI